MTLIKKTVAVAALVAALLAVSAPMAAARFDLNPPTGNTPAQTAPVEPQVHTSASSAAGFSWGDAAIGAAFTFTVLGLATTAVFLTRRGRTATS